MIHVKRPADPIDFADLASARGGIRARAYMVGLVQVLGGPSVAVRDDAGPLAIAGLYPTGAGAVAWLIAAPAAAARFPGVFLGLRSALRREAHLWRAIAAEVEDGNAAGERLARALGFRPTEQRAGGARVWQMTGGDHG
jgi:hypothetical protein